eukprot:gene17094-17284_t
MDASSVDFILTDPPYICRYRDRSGRRVANDDNSRWLKPSAYEMHRLLKPDSLCVSFYGWQQADRFIEAWREAGFRLVGHLVFAKAYASSERFLRHQHEQAYLLAKGDPEIPETPISDVCGWVYTGNRLHPTEKPVSVLEPLVEVFCPAGGLVLDPFCGSGSTLVAAANRGRDFLGIELDYRHCRGAKNRVSRDPAADERAGATPMTSSSTRQETSSADSEAAFEAEIDAVIAACDGDQRAALRAMAIMVSMQESQLEQLATEIADMTAAVSRGHARGRFQVPDGTPG